MQNSSAELFPLSWLSQYGYCPRRCSLLALEQIWQENEYTAAGRAQHDRVHTARIERRGPTINVYELSVFSRTLGVSGKCDCIEATECSGGVPLPWGAGAYSLYPVEYKHGAVRDEKEYHLQLCAEAICLEEQFCTSIPVGALFFIDAHRRDEVLLNDELRTETRKAAAGVQKMLENQVLLPAEYGPKCKKCSLQDDCRPKLRISARDYCSQLWEEFTEEVPL